MLEFFVLGEIPGTNLQISFNAILLGCVIAGLIVMLKLRTEERGPTLKLIIPSRRHLGLKNIEPKL